MNRRKIERDIKTSITGVCSRHRLPIGNVKAAANTVVTVLLQEAHQTKQHHHKRLPKRPPELYAERPIRKECGRRENVVEFLRRVWKPWMDVNALTRADLAKLDGGAYKAVDNWLRQHGDMPRDINLPFSRGRPRKRRVQYHSQPP
jgi:hypothetical protein